MKLFSKFRQSEPAQLQATDKTNRQPVTAKQGRGRSETATASGDSHLERRAATHALQPQLPQPADRLTPPKNVAAAANAWTLKLAALWRAVRPGSKPNFQQTAAKALRLQQAVQDQPADQRLSMLTQLAQHAVQHDENAEATMFCRLTLFDALRRQASPNGSERADMLLFARIYDDKFLFTSTKPYDQVSFDASQEQLSRLGQHPASELLGYIYLDHVRKQNKGSTDSLDLAASLEVMNKLVTRLAPLRTTDFFRPEYS